MSLSRNIVFFILGVLAGLATAFSPLAFVWSGRQLIDSAIAVGFAAALNLWIPIVFTGAVAKGSPGPPLRLFPKLHHAEPIIAALGAVLGFLVVAGIAVADARILDPVKVLILVANAYMLFAVAGLIFIAERSRSHLNPGLCVRCGYDVTGLGRCPECGSPSPRRRTR